MGQYVKAGSLIFGYATRNPETYKEGEYRFFFYSTPKRRDKEAEETALYMPEVKRFEIDIAKVLGLTGERVRPEFTKRRGERTFVRHNLLITVYWIYPGTPRFQFRKRKTVLSWYRVIRLGLVGINISPFLSNEVDHA